MGRISTGIFIVAGTLLFSGASPGNPPDAPPTGIGVKAIVPTIAPAAMDRLLGDLAHDDWHIREQAHKAIVATGPAILGPLEARLGQVETIHLRDAILRAIEETRQAAVGRGTAIHATFAGATVADVLRTLQSQSGIKLGVDVIDPAEPVSASFDGWTWWQTVGRLCRENDWDLRAFAGGMALRPAGSAPTLGGPVDLSGPLAVICRGARYERDLVISRSENLTWPTPDAVGGAMADAMPRHERGARFEYDFEGYLEPRFVVGSRSFEVVWTEARDDAGNTLLPIGSADLTGLGNDLLGIASPVAPEKGMLGNRSEATWQSGRLVFSAPLTFPRQPGETLELAGRLRASVGAELTLYEATTTQMTQGARWRVAGEQVEVRAEPGRTPNRWMVIFETLRDPGSEALDVMIAGFTGTELFDQAGQKLRRGTALRQESAAGGVIYRMEFIGPDPDGPTIPSKLSATLPARLVELDLPFRFKNLPMP